MRSLSAIAVAAAGVAAVSIQSTKFYSVFLDSAANLGKQGWLERWTSPTLPSWHLNSPHPNLVKHHELLGEPKNTRVFVPLCGAALDVAWLANKGHRVVGVEFSDVAIKKLFSEAKISYSLQDTLVNNLQCFRNDAARIAVYHGDFFKVDASVTGRFDAVWDRASLVAIAPELRQKYVDNILDLLREGGRVLLDTFEYNQKEMNGPPYSVSFDEVKKLYGKRAKVELIETSNEMIPTMKSRGVTSMKEHVMLVTKY